jgi:putative ABC transport system substrate-binding protein
MLRREFIVGIGSAVARPLAARAQQPTIPVIRFLNTASPETFSAYVTAFGRGLAGKGYLEGQNVAIETGGRAL